MAKQICNDHEKNMEQPFLSQEETNNIEIDLKFLESMKTDRKATFFGHSNH